MAEGVLVPAPAPRGNHRALKHGSYARLRLAPRAQELADELRPLVPLYTPAHEPALQLLAMTLARCEAASVALAAADEAVAAGDATGLSAYGKKAQALERLRDDARGWIRQSVKLLETLGMTPSSAAKMGLQLALAEGTVAQLVETGRAVRIAREAS